MSNFDDLIKLVRHILKVIFYLFVVGIIFSVICAILLFKSAF